MLLPLVRTVATVPVPPAGRAAARPLPALCLRGVAIGDSPAVRRVDLEAWPGELVHLGGGSAAQRLQVLRLASGLAHPLAGPCRRLGHVLEDAALPGHLAVPDFVAEPLLAEGLDLTEARTRAELELYLLGASGLRQRQPPSLSMPEARQVRLARATVTRPALLVLAWPDRGLDAEPVRALRLVLTTLACTFGSCVLLTSDDPRLQACADRHIDLDRPG